MIVEFDKSFYKSLDKIKNATLQEKINAIIPQLEEAATIHSIRNVKKLIGFKSYYRIKIGDYRLGFELIEIFKIRLIIIEHRKNIYRKFP